MGTRHWTLEEDALVARSRGTDTARLARLLGRSPRALMERRCDLRARRTARQRATGVQPYRDWSPTEIAFLRRNAGTMSAPEAAAALGRSQKGVEGKAKKLGLSWRVPRHIERHRGYTAHDVARLLGLHDANVGYWLRGGYLRGTQRLTRAGIYRRWRIDLDALEDFLTTYRWLYQPERITDRGWRAYVDALPAERYVTCAEAARELCLSVSALHASIARGDLFAVRLVGSVGPTNRAPLRVPWSAIRAYRPPRLGSRLDPELTMRRRQTLARMERVARPAPAEEEVA